MKCVLCPKPIDPVNDDFEEVGSIEFAHVECRDRVEGTEEDPVDSLKEESNAARR